MGGCLDQSVFAATLRGSWQPASRPGRPFPTVAPVWQVAVPAPDGRLYNLSRYYARWTEPRPESYMCVCSTRGGEGVQIGGEGQTEHLHPQATLACQPEVRLTRWADPCGSKGPSWGRVMLAPATAAQRGRGDSPAGGAGPRHSRRPRAAAALPQPGQRRRVGCAARPRSFHLVAALRSMTPIRAALSGGQLMRKLARWVVPPSSLLFF